MAGQGVQPTLNHYNKHGLLVAPKMILRALRGAYAQRGTPYVWGGSAPGGFDCSGLVYWAYRRAGYMNIGRTTYTQINQGKPVAQAHLQPGDIVFPTPHHEGLYIGNGMVLEAPHTGDQVKVIPLSEFGFWQARRLIAGGGGIIPPRGIAGQNGFGLPVGSSNPQDRQPHPDFAGEMATFQAQQAAQNRQMQQMFAQQQKQMLAAQKAMQVQMTQNAAKARQQQLSDQVAAQAQARVASAQAAQRGLSVGTPGVTSSDPTIALYQDRKLRLDDLRNQAVRKAGIGL